MAEHSTHLGDPPRFPLGYVNDIVQVKRFKFKTVARIPFAQLYALATHVVTEYQKSINSVPLVNSDYRDTNTVIVQLISQ